MCVFLVVYAVLYISCYFIYGLVCLGARWGCVLPLQGGANLAGPISTLAQGNAIFKPPTPGADTLCWCVLTGLDLVSLLA